MGQDNPGKIFYRVGEVSQLVGVESYVLRYWEKMFPQLSPKKDEAGQRVYTKSEIDMVMHIKNLLYEERYTIDGAKRKLKEESKQKNQHKTVKYSQESLEILGNVRSILQEVSDMLEKK